MNSEMTVTARIAHGGRIVIPAEYRRILGLRKGDEITLTLVDGEVRLVPRVQALRRAQAIVARYGGDDRSDWADELIAERRAEAGHD